MHKFLTCPTTAAKGKYSLPYPRAAALFAAAGTAPLVESRTSEAVGAAAARRDSRSREARDGRDTAAEGNDVTRRGGRCGSEVESAVAVAMEAGLVRQRRSCGRALSPLLILVFQRESHRRIWAVRSAWRFERKGIKMSIWIIGIYIFQIRKRKICIYLHYKESKQLKIFST